MGHRYTWAVLGLASLLGAGCVMSDRFEVRESRDRDGRPTRETRMHDAAGNTWVVGRVGEEHDARDTPGFSREVDYPPEAHREAPRASIPETERSAAPPAEVVAVRGRWQPDVDATLRENLALSEEFRAALKMDLEQNPFELQITADRYISTSHQKIIVDGYTVSAVKPDGVTIALRAIGRTVDRDPRQVRLFVRDDRLTIYFPEHFMNVVFRRLKEDGPARVPSAGSAAP